MLEQSVLDRFTFAQAASPGAGYVSNFLGLRTRTEWFAHARDFDGQHLPQLPVPHDQIYGSWSEYASLLTAIEQTPCRDAFTIVELGAGWGPWISAAGLVCQRLDFRNINLIAVEADPLKAALIPQHLAANGLTTPPVNLRVLQAAAWGDDKPLFFPSDPVIQDYGAAACDTLSERDYRGLRYIAAEVQGLSLATIVADHPIIDYTHWDIQGAELVVASGACDLLCERFRFVMIGTHSPPIEGGLMQLFFEMGWQLEHHKPCQYEWDASKPTIEAMNCLDGEMFFSNPRLL